MPFAESYDFMPHQDYPFNFGSLNSRPVWELIEIAENLAK